MHCAQLLENHETRLRPSVRTLRHGRRRDRRNPVGRLSVPASAAESDQLWIAAPYEKNLQIGPEGATPVEVGLNHDNDTFTVTDGRLTVDASGLAGVAEVIWPENCAPSGTTAVCAVAQVPVIGPDYTPQVLQEAHAAEGAEAGKQGRTTYAATATGGPEGTAG
ncbi:hypothetical protein [Streptomyces rubiginosohelvolus]|uniref:hypothetical protein n=1 Tax=Streptomyces rubiginosohelvolus TaxID=67362 RepID=UPI0033C2EBDB